LLHNILKIRVGVRVILEREGKRRGRVEERRGAKRNYLSTFDSQQLPHTGRIA